MEKPTSIPLLRMARIIQAKYFIKRSALCNAYGLSRLGFETAFCLAFSEAKIGCTIACFVCLIHTSLYGIGLVDDVLGTDNLTV